MPCSPVRRRRRLPFPATALVLLLAVPLVPTLTACSAGDADRRQVVFVATQASAGTATRILVDPASLSATEKETTVRYTVETTSPGRREAYPGQPQRIEGAIAFDCRARRFRKLAEVSYGFDGQQQPPDAAAMQPGEIDAGSPSEVLLDYACADRLERWWTRYPVERPG